MLRFKFLCFVFLWFLRLVFAFQFRILGFLISLFRVYEYLGCGLGFMVIVSELCVLWFRVWMFGIQI